MSDFKLGVLTCHLSASQDLWRKTKRSAVHENYYKFSLSVWMIKTETSFRHIKTEGLEDKASAGYVI